MLRMCRHEEVSRHHLRNERQAHGAHGQERGAQEAAQDARRHLFIFVNKLLCLARHLEQKPSTPKGFAHAAGIADFVRCLRNAAAELECADWSSSSTFVIRDARSEVRAGSRAYGGGGTIMHEV